MKTIIDLLNFEFEKIHAKFRTVSIIHLKQLKEELYEWRNSGLISEKFFKQNYGGFIFNSNKILTSLKSIIVISIPQKITPVNFFYKDRQYQTFIPPTYIYSKYRAACKKILSKILVKKGYSIVQAKLPLKLLAVRSGIADYGKNNLCYVKDMGSFFRLEAFYTDYNFAIDDWHEKKIMKACKTCSLCQNVCPTKCIPKDRFLIYAAHCLTHFNENKGDFPSCINPRFHKAIVGCMYCQIICPQNKNFFQSYEQTINFSEEEIAVLLQNIPRKFIPKNLAKKLADLNLYEYYSLLGRNLSVLMKK